MTNKQKVIETLIEVASDLKLLNDDFYVIGSAALLLSDISLHRVYDIDILTSTNDAHLLRAQWHSNRLENPILQNNDLFQSLFTRYRFNLMDIEILGDLKINTNDRWELLQVHEFETLELDGLSIKYASLNELKRIFKSFGRKKDLDKLKLLEEQIE